MNGGNPVVQKILDGQGMPYTAILPPQKGYRNLSYPVRLQSGQLINVLFYKSEPGSLALIQNANRVSDYLAIQGMPCRQTLGRIAKLSGERITKYAVTYTYLPGHTIPWEAYTMKHIKQLGKTLGDLHAALRTFPDELPDITEQCEALNTRMQHYFSSINVVRALHQKLDLRIPVPDAEQMLRQVRSLGNTQALHMDFVRGNILFDEQPVITGILDFEKTAHGHVLFDIARTLAFLLVDCKYKTEDKVRKYFLLSGYGKRSASELPSHPELLEQLVDFYLTYDFYKFLRHNPYEYLPQNDHFVRTRNLLQARNILK